jgi:ribosome-associated protein
MSALRITARLSIPDSEIEEQFIQASGPGGQNVNKVASAVQLRFDVAHSPSLPEEVRTRLKVLAGQRLTKDGVLVMTGRTYRTQERNRADVRERLKALIARACIAPKTRRPTKPTLASKKRRLEGKTQRAKIKRARGKPGMDS